MTDAQKTRRRRVARRIVLAVTVVVLLLGLSFAWTARREPLEIRRSRGLRMGMTKSEVEAVMGRPDLDFYVSSRHGKRDYFRYGRKTMVLYRVANWVGLGGKVPDDFPVMVGFDENGHLYHIERGGEIEEVPSGSGPRAEFRDGELQISQPPGDRPAAE